MSERTLVAGLDIGGTKTLAVAVDASHDGAAAADVAAPPPGSLLGTGPAPVVATVRRTSGSGGAALLRSTTEALIALADAAGVPVDGFGAVGVGVPGLVDREAGTVRHAVNLGLDDEPLPLADHLRARASTPVLVDNDVNLAAVGAAVALGCRGDLAYLSVGTGLAAGLLLDGRIRRGAHGAAGEIGHLPVDPGGPWCECGQRGCLEAVASGTAIASRWPAVDGTLTAASSLLAAAGAGDPAAVAVLDEVADHLAGAVALLVQAVDPEVVVLGGGVAEAGPGLLDAVRRALRARAARSPVLAALHQPDRVALVPDGLPAGALGAAVLARHHLDLAAPPPPDAPRAPAAPLADVSCDPA